MTYLKSDPADPLQFDVEALKERGLELADDYAVGDPFPHTVIDNFLPPAMVDLCIDQFPTIRDPDSLTFNRNQERLKTSFNPDYLSGDVRALFYALNSRPFISVIENITGIKGLIPDPYFIGGGFHEITNGGHLSVHADFNHHVPLNLERRINILIYLNRDWKDEYGGQLELWRTDMSECVQSVTPVANRCAIFTTTQSSMHGNPNPINHPDNVSRKSIALYYYTATWDETSVSKTTQFRPRPGTEDRNDWAVKIDGAIKNFVPPALSRQALRLRQRIWRD